VKAFSMPRSCPVVCAVGGAISALAASATAPAPSSASASIGASHVSTGRPSLQEALAAAWQRSVAARENEGRRQRAQAEGEAAKPLWAGPPALEISHRNDRLQGHAGQRELEVGVSVPLWLPGQRAATASTAQAASAQAEAAEQAERLHLAGELREAAWLLSALEAETAQATAHTLALRQLAADVERRVQAGDLARADALAAQAEHLAAAAQQAETGLRLQAARARWTLLTGLVAAPDLGAGHQALVNDTVSERTSPRANDQANDRAREKASERGSEKPSDHSAAPGAAMTPGVTQPPASHLEQHPQWLLARQTTTLARQRVELLRLSNRDAPELSLGLRQDIPGRGAGSQGSLGVALRLPLATEARNRPQQVQALTELALAEAQAQRLRERLDSDLTQAHQALQAEEARLRAEAERARLLRERAALIDKSFRAGESALPDLLRALHAAAQADGAVARQTAARGLALARLQQALGLLP